MLRLYSPLDAAGVENGWMGISLSPLSDTLQAGDDTCADGA